MVQNLKVDIIYHQTASDFEMEFNLCGCCRMRLLNDKTTDKKGFVRALARGVSRSRVIMACGPLFGAEGLIGIVATAIGGGLAVCDNKTYGINGEEAIEIIKGSTPLVTPDGYFGGCIIESGPQTIILLTENRAFRKAIMQNLIHPYVEEISYIPTKAVASAPAPAPEAVPETVPLAETEEYITDVETVYGEEPFTENAYEAAPPVTDEHNIEFVMDGDPVDQPVEEYVEAAPVAELESENNFDNMYIEVEKPKEIKARYEQAYAPSQEDQMFITSDEEALAEQKGKKQNKSRAVDISIVVLILILLLAVLALVYFVFLKPYTMGVSTGDYLKEIFSASSGNSLGV